MTNSLCVFAVCKITMQSSEWLSKDALLLAQFFIATLILSHTYEPIRIFVPVCWICLMHATHEYYFFSQKTDFVFWVFFTITGSHLGSTNNPYFYLWIIASIISSCYAYTWDIKMDWGLLEMRSGDSKFLREETVYSSNVNNIYNSLLSIYENLQAPDNIWYTVWYYSMQRLRVAYSLRHSSRAKKN